MIQTNIIEVDLKPQRGLRQKPYKGFYLMHAGYNHNREDLILMAPTMSTSSHKRGSNSQVIKRVNFTYAYDHSMLQ